MKKTFIEGNQIHNFISSSGSGTVINYGSGYGSGSTSQKVTVPTVPVPVPVPQHCKKRLKKSKNVFFKCVLDVNFAPIKGSVFFIF
jgi:hypothetical protein